MEPRKTTLICPVSIHHIDGKGASLVEVRCMRVLSGDHKQKNSLRSSPAGCGCRAYIKNVLHIDNSVI